jgi:hypothetical protein
MFDDGESRCRDCREITTALDPNGYCHYCRSGIVQPGEPSHRLREDQYDPFDHPDSDD